MNNKKRGRVIRALHKRMRKGTISSRSIAKIKLQKMGVIVHWRYEHL